MEPVVALTVVLLCVIVSSIQLVPAWSVTLLLWVIAPLALWHFGAEYAPWNVVYISLHPVLLVFLAGFAFAVAAQRHGIDEKLTRRALRLARGEHVRLLVLLAAVTVWLSAWISNIAAAALMFGAIRPLLQQHLINHGQERSVVLTVAVAANLGGMATPIGTGANAVAISAVRGDRAISFLEWMIFAVPLTVLLVGAVVAAVIVRVRPPIIHPHARREVRPGKPFDPRTAILFGTVVVMWLAEPLHHIAAHWVAVAGVVLLVATRAIHWDDVRRMDWQSLVLIAGGIGLGAIMNQSGAARMLVEWLPISADSPRVSLFVLCVLSATLAAIMSNTGTAALVIPIAIALVPNPSTAIIVALATGLGFPFVISTPANAMAVRQGADPRDLMWFGVPTIILGSALLALTGPFVLGMLGIP